MQRRSFVKAAAAASILAGLPRYSMAAAKGSDIIKVGLIGCGSRGTGAMCNMIDADQNIQVVALADLFADKIVSSKNRIQKACAKYAGKEIFKVAPEAEFVGFDAYEKLLSIPEIDVVILATPPIFRPAYIEAALKAGKHIFAEKPVAIDAVGARKVREELIPLANEKKLCVVCGTQTRYFEAYQDIINRIRDGQIGDITAAQVIRYEPMYLDGWMQKECADMDPNLVDFQMRNWLAFRWTSGDQYVEQHIHNLDIILWGLGDIEPLDVVGRGGRALNLNNPRQGDRFSNMAVTYTFPGDVTVTSMCCQENNTSGMRYEKFVGTKGTATLSFSGPYRITGEKPYEYTKGKGFGQSLVNEHKFLLDHIRNGEHTNKMPEQVNSCLIAIAGREAAYSGKRFKYAWIKEKSQQCYLDDYKSLALGQIRKVEPVPVQGEYKLV